MKTALNGSLMEKDESWPHSIAVGDEKYVSEIKQQFGIKARKHPILKSEISEEIDILKEPLSSYQ